ncbi:MAG: DUF4160 domain-containing protein [Parcubacteria group bacterium]
MKITTGIASTTHIDRHNERMAKSALDSMVEQIKKKFIPQLIEHDPNQHIGVVLYGEVFQLKDGEYALGIVSGIFENEQEKKRHKTGSPNDAWKDYKKYLDIDELVKMNEQNHQVAKTNNSKQSNIADLLETHLDSTQILPNGTVYKIKRFIAATGDLKIEVYPKDHEPKHFHVVSKKRKINARFDIETLAHINNKQGSISSGDIKKIQNFFESCPKKLEFVRNEHARLSN